MCFILHVSFKMLSPLRVGSQISNNLHVCGRVVDRPRVRVRISVKPYMHVVIHAPCTHITSPIKRCHQNCIYPCDAWNIVRRVIVPHTVSTWFSLCVSFDFPSDSVSFTNGYRLPLPRDV